MVLLDILAILLLLGVNGFYVASEFAAVGVRRSRVNARAEEGQQQAKRLHAIVGDAGRLDRHIATCQVGITLSSLVLGAYGQVAFTRDLAALLPLESAAALSVAAFVVLVGLSTVQVVLGELVPKSLALQFPTRTAMATVALTDWSRLLFTPLILVLNGSAWGLLRVLRVRAAGARHVHGPDELEMLVAESGREGVLDKATHRRLRGALRLRQMTARDVMVPRERVFAVRHDQTLGEVRDAVISSAFTRIPVRRDSGIVGLLHTKDILLRHDEGLAVAELMRPIPTVSPSLSGDRLVTALRDARAQMATVGEGGRLGIVTFEDILSDMLDVREADHG